MAERTVRFYEILDAKKQRLPADIPLEELQDSIRLIPDADAYVQVERMELLGSTYVPTVGAKAAVRLIALDKITRNARLRIERRRNYRPLILEEDETLAEPTFYSLFSHNVLGVMRNSGAAPGPTSFRDYVNKAELLSEPIEIAPLADPNALRALRDVERLTKVQLQVGPEVAASTFSAGFIRDAIATFRENLGGVDIEFTIKMRRAGQNEMSDAVLNEIEREQAAGNLGLAEKAKMFYRSLEDGRVHAYDFLNEAVTQAVDVDLEEATGQPTEPSAAQGMAAAYDQLHDDIQSALNLPEQ